MQPEAEIRITASMCSRFSRQAQAQSDPRTAIRNVKHASMWAHEDKPDKANETIQLKMTRIVIC